MGDRIQVEGHFDENGYLVLDTPTGGQAIFVPLGEPGDPLAGATDQECDQLLADKLEPGSDEWKAQLRTLRDKAVRMRQLREQGVPEDWDMPEP